MADNNQISAAEREAGVTVRGSAEPGSEVTILLAALSAQITTAANGQWSVVFSSGDIPASPASNVTLTATARDAAGNVSAQ
ncbi:MAG: Ig-like domain-containing protein, partial [bacterium]